MTPEFQTVLVQVHSVIIFFLFVFIAIVFAMVLGNRHVIGKITEWIAKQEENNQP